MTDNNTPNTISIPAQLEALLFVTAEPVSINQLATALDISPNKVEAGLVELKQLLSQRGLRIQEHRGRYLLTTAPEAAELVEHYLGIEASSKLSKAALETLAIIAYQQPVTRPQVDSIRGVNSDGVMRTLLSRALIEESGRAEGPGRPILYNTTPEFLQQFGLGSLNELPELELDLESNDSRKQEVLKD